MENVEKLRVLVQHWIDHNKSHAEEFSKWEKIMIEDAEGKIAAHISEAVQAVEKVNKQLSKALSEAGGPKEVDGEGHHHHHGDHHHH